MRFDEQGSTKPILQDRGGEEPMSTSPEGNFVARLKCGAVPWNPYRILSPAGERIGELCLITRDIASEHDTVAMLCKWRSNHRDRFLTVFNPTLDSTKRYLQTIYLPDNTRVLFLLKEYDRFVGNFGLAHISGESAELDNVIRSEDVKHKSFMQHAQLALIGWASESMSIKKFYLHVLSENVKAIRHYERVGFGAVSSTPLRRQNFDDGYKLIPDPEASRSDLALLRMELNI
ncbi:GNAT family N-acetyltransferase [Methylobacterium mesophilicum SR1.6/6]|uniref:GNAT family N-acetyltransferase n=1 Tax=Methylobacterium mesophilicum SR1.6/6 TaxID=908290 RepID=A0A6B9FHM5_9HYPH|nr:GNAT family protein [Methylobacterium mesophilicum]QGY00715.1 GNAT family N-acetyltransferase [Methylobacterium mesophilicum SR1.6/6]